MPRPGLARKVNALLLPGVTVTVATQTAAAVITRISSSLNLSPRIIAAHPDFRTAQHLAFSLPALAVVS